INEINGVALLPNGNFIVANGNTGTEFHEVDPIAEALTGVSYDTGLSLNAGDLAGVCFDSGGLETPANGECHATQIIDYVEGSSSDGGAIAANRTDASNALGTPERLDQLTFVSLGYGGSLTLSFNGSVL